MICVTWTFQKGKAVINKSLQKIFTLGSGLWLCFPMDKEHTYVFSIVKQTLRYHELPCITYWKTNSQLHPHLKLIKSLSSVRHAFENASEPQLRAHQTMLTFPVSLWDLVLSRRDLPFFVCYMWWMSHRTMDKWEGTEKQTLRKQDPSKSRLLKSWIWCKKSWFIMKIIYRFLSKSVWSSDYSSESSKNLAIILSQSFGNYIKIKKSTAIDLARKIPSTEFEENLCTIPSTKLTLHVLNTSKS